MGLNRPFIIQYGTWMRNMLKGDMGTSYMTGRPVITELTVHMPYTIILTLSSIILTLAFSIPLGILAAIKHNRWMDYIIRFFTFIGTSIPSFFCLYS